MERLTELYKARASPSATTPQVAAAERGSSHGAIVLCPPSAIQDVWSRSFPDPVTASRRAGCGCARAPASSGVELPLVISDHADWPDLCRTIRETGADEVWVTHGQEDALVHWCGTQGIARAARCTCSATATREAEAAEPPPCERRRRVNDFAALLDRLAYEPRRNAKLRLMRTTSRTRPIRSAARRSPP